MNLTDSQKAAVDEIQHNLQLIACAGSGQTEVISRRIAHILASDKTVRPEEIVAFTFTRKAAENMVSRIKSRLSENGLDSALAESISIGTIHAYCYGLLKKYSSVFEQYELLDDVKTKLFIQRYHDQCGAATLNIGNGSINRALFLSCISKLADDYDNRDNWPQEDLKAFEEYRSCLYSHRFIDFSLLIFETFQQIEKNEALRNKIRSIRYLVVDEYQDVDDLQEKLIREIAKENCNICVVGDDDQTIYQFLGSNADNIIGFSKRYSDVVRINLEENFRSSGEIVDIADTSIKSNTKRLAKQMKSVQGLRGIKAVARRANSQEDEFSQIARTIAECHEQGTAYDRIAVLVRKGKYINPICGYLDRNSIPYVTDSSDYFFTGMYYGRLKDTLKNVVELDKAQLYAVWKDVLTDDAFRVGFKCLRSFSRNGGFALEVPLAGIIKEFAEITGLLDESAADYKERSETVRGICGILDDYDTIYGDRQLSARLSGVINFLEHSACDEYKNHSFSEKAEAGVQVMTVHKSKGLEFDTVIIPELEQGEFPLSNYGGKKYWHVLGKYFAEKKEKYESDMEDERKLFYVAVTRAIRQLYFFYNLSKKPISLFVKEAALSDYLEIDKADLQYEPPKPVRASAYSGTGRKKNDDDAEFSEEEIAYEVQRAKWQIARYARKQLRDYYGTAAHAIRGPAAAGAWGDFHAVSNMSDDEVIQSAISNGLIPSEYTITIRR